LPKGLWYEDWAMAGKPVPVPGDDEIQRWFQDLRFQSRLTNEEMEEFDAIDLGDLTIYHGLGSRNMPSLSTDMLHNSSMKKLRELGSSLRANPMTQGLEPLQLKGEFSQKKRGGVAKGPSSTFGSEFRDTSTSLSDGRVSSKRMLYLAERMKNAGPNRLATWAKAAGISTRTGRKVPQAPLGAEVPVDDAQIYARALGGESDDARRGTLQPSTADTAEPKMGKKATSLDSGSSDRAATVGKSTARESLPSAGAQPLTTLQEQEKKTRKSTSAATRRRKSQICKVGNAFEMCVFLSKRHYLPLGEVRDRLREYNALDVNGDGGLSRAEFMRAIKLRCNIPEDEDFPSNFFDDSWKHVDKDGSGEIDFEEYLLWSVNHQWCQELCVSNAEDRELRRIAREYGFVLPDVEALKSVFDRFDVDGSGQIDESEFRSVLIQLMKIQVDEVPTRKMKQYFREVDGDGSGEVSFEEFVVWYISVYSVNPLVGPD